MEDRNDKNSCPLLSLPVDRLMVTACEENGGGSSLVPGREGDQNSTENPSCF